MTNPPDTKDDNPWCSCSGHAVTTDEKWVEQIRQWKEGGKPAEELAAAQPYTAAKTRVRTTQPTLE